MNPTDFSTSPSTPAARPDLPRYEYRPAVRDGFEIVHHFLHRGRPSNLTVAYTGFENIAQDLVNGFNERAALAARVAELEAANAKMRESLVKLSYIAEHVLGGRDLTGAIKDEAERIYYEARDILRGLR